MGITYVNHEQGNMWTMILKPFHIHCVPFTIKTSNCSILNVYSFKSRRNLTVLVSFKETICLYWALRIESNLLPRFFEGEYLKSQIEWLCLEKCWNILWTALAIEMTFPSHFPKASVPAPGCVSDPGCSYYKWGQLPVIISREIPSTVTGRKY